MKNFTFFSSENRFITTIVVITAVILIAGAAFGLRRGARNPNELAVAMLTGYPPFYQVNNQGEAEGFDIDVAKKLAQLMGKQLVIKTMTTAENIIALEQGKVDLLISGLCITKTRCKRFNFVHYVGKPRSTFPLVFWKEIPEGVRSLDDLIKKYPEAQVIVEPGSSWNEFVDAVYPGINATFIPSYLDMVLELKKPSRTLKAMVFDPDILSEFVAKFPDLKVIDAPMRDFAIPGMGIALKKGNPDLLATIDRLIGQLKADGTLDALERKWFNN